MEFYATTYIDDFFKSVWHAAAHGASIPMVSESGGHVDATARRRADLTICPIGPLNGAVVSAQRQMETDGACTYLFADAVAALASSRRPQ